MDGFGAADDNCGRSVLTVMEMSSTRACFMFTARRFIRRWLTRVHSWTQKGALQEGAFGACLALLASDRCGACCRPLMLSCCYA